MSKPTHWDAIVIGSGLGSLSAAAAFANRGKRVLVLERLANFGGAATVYRHGALTIEASLHETDGDTLFGASSVFDRLGLAGSIEAIATDRFCEVRGGPLTAPVQVPTGLDQAHQSLRRSFPDAKVALDSYFLELKHLYRSLRDVDDLGAAGPSALLELLFSGRLFELIGDARQTVSQRFDALFGDNEALKLVLGAPIAYFDDDPAKLSFLLFAGVWSRYVESGSYYLKGGSHALALALLKHVKERSGEARHKCNVVSILLDAEGRAAGVAYQDEAGTLCEALAPIVFAGAAPAAVAAMLAPDKRAAFNRKYEDLEPSISLFNLTLGLSRPAAEFGITAYSTFVYPDDMQCYAEYPLAAARLGREHGGTMPPYVIADYGRLDTGLSRPQDLHLVTLCGVDRLAWWEGLDEAAEVVRRKRWIDALIADVDRRYPGLSGAVGQAEIATARTMKTRLGTPHGEVYGFRPTPSRLFGRIPSAATSIEGLWLSSAYTVCGGYAGAMRGGLMAADASVKASLTSSG